MIVLLDQRDPLVAEQIYQLQQASYAVERDLIDQLEEEGYGEYVPLFQGVGKK